MSVVKFREITAADVPALFHVRPRTRENAMTLEELQRHDINPQSVTESLTNSTKGWLCEDAGEVVAFSMADRATGEFLVIAVLPEYEGKGIGGRLMALTKEWLAASGCMRSWLTTDLDTSLRAYGFYRRQGWTDWKIERGLR
jgi:GNAT superfamily N-acetyltransferase